MPVSTEKNFDEKFNLFKEWLTQQDNFKDKGHLITANESSIASGLIYKGPGIVKNIKTDMIKILKSENINNIEEAVGINS